MFFMGVLPGETRSPARVAGEAPALRFSRPFPFTVGRGPVPRRASIGTENGLGWRSVFAQVERSRGTGPRATGPEGFSSLCAVREQASPNYSLLKVLKDLKRCFSRVRSRGTGPRATVKKSVPFTVGRGPVPRRASIGTGNGVGWRSVFA